MAVFLFGRGAPTTIDPVFSSNSWKQIVKACQMNKVPDTWEVGDYKNMTINGEEYLVVIIGKNHDAYSDGTGTAPLTMQLLDIYETAYRFASTNSNRSGWENSEMRITHLPAIMALMPSEVRDGIREISKKTSAGGRSETIITTADKLFLLAETEAQAASTYSAAGEGTLYSYYSDTMRRVKARSGYGYSWWLRSPNEDNEFTFCEVSPTGSGTVNTANNTSGVSFAFCF